MISPNPNCISNPPIPKSWPWQANCRKAKGLFASRCGRFMITSAIHWFIPTMEQNWGAQAALGPMGADCTEYTDLLVALSRAQGIPARYFEGLLYLDKGTDALAKTEHAWPDVYMPSVWLGRTGSHPGTATGQPRHVFCPLYTGSYYRHDGGEPVRVAGRQLLDASLLAGEQYHDQVTGDWKIELVNKQGQ